MGQRAEAPGEVSALALEAAHAPEGVGSREERGARGSRISVLGPQASGELWELMANWPHSSHLTKTQLPGCGRTPGSKEMPTKPTLRQLPP